MNEDSMFLFSLMDVAKFIMDVVQSLNSERIMEIAKIIMDVAKIIMDVAQSNSGCCQHHYGWVM